VKLVLDESIERQIADALKSEGYQIWYILDMERGISDDKVLALANSNDAILLTADKDFGELVFRKNMISVGVVLLRIFGLANSEKAALALRVMEEHGTEMLNAFTVVTTESVRIRRINSSLNSL
jgi:predicted nuclease of predicted toxin-antitoxin system